MRLIANRLLVEFHEWAWSQRTSNFPVVAITATGELVELGGTQKAETFYRLSAATKWVARYYKSYSGSTREVTVYEVPSLQAKVIGTYEQLEGLEQPLKNALEARFWGEA